MQPWDLEKAETKSYCSSMSSHSEKEESIAEAAVVEELPFQSSRSDEDYPDGGWQAWLTVAGAFCALLCTFGQLNSFGTFQSWYAENQLSHLPPSTISWIGALQLWVFFFSVRRAS